MYYVEVRHDGLKKYKQITGRNKYLVDQKAIALRMQWDDMWDRKLKIDELKNKKILKLREHEENRIKASQLTSFAQENLNSLNLILSSALNKNFRIHWDELKVISDYDEAKPVEPILNKFPEKPEYSNFQPKIGFIDTIIPFLANAKILKAQKNYDLAVDVWEYEKNKIKKYNEYISEKYKIDYTEWMIKKENFEIQKSEKNQKIDDLKNNYILKQDIGICEYFDFVLSIYNYPDFMPHKYDLNFNNNIIIIDYVFPNKIEIPNLKEVTYVQSTCSYKDLYLSENKLNEIYDKLLYDITIRIINDIFISDYMNHVESIIFNGIVNFISPSNGKKVNSCILTIHVNKAEFMDLNLKNIDSRACFKYLKGVGSSKLHSLSPVAPIMQINKSDKRFVDHQNIGDKINEQTNLATMDWQEFEHLVREIFEREFSAVGGEVKVTQSSRDGGVDAVIFDPDPIRGGKIIVQAKRYNNTVGVSAIRDLYGTLMNEGANKGIIITTSDYGPDAYTFAKDKPITLLNGGHLLHLISKNGYNAKIDLGESKREKFNLK